jgi:hypothetical protein
MTHSNPMIQSLLWPVQSMVDFFSPPVPAKAHSEHTHAQSMAIPTSTIHISRKPASPVLVGRHTASAVTHRAPRVDHTVRTRRTGDGRLVISGRMSDVCAELDRLCAGA